MNVMDRGDRREDIFVNDVDRQDFLKTLARSGSTQEAGQPRAWAGFHPRNEPCYGLTPFRVSPNQGLLSLLGPTVPCRGRSCPCKYVKARRLHIGICFLRTRMY